MQEARADARGVEAQIGDDRSDTHGVDDVRLSGFARLARVHPVAVVVSSLDQVGISRRLVRPDALDELFDLEHLRSRIRDSLKKCNTPVRLRQS